MPIIMPAATERRTDAVNFLLTTKVLLVVLGITLIPLVLLELWSSIEWIKTSGWAPCPVDSRKSRELGRYDTKLRGYLFMQLSSGLAVVALMCLPTFAVPFPQSLNCDITAKAVCILYCTSTQLTLLFFLTKAELVNDVLRNQKITSLTRWTRFGLLVFIPCFIVPYAVIRAKGVVTAEGVCVLFLQDVWFPVSFTFGSIFLSILLLFLFVRPLMEQAKKTAKTNSANSKVMLRTAYKNVRLAIIIVIFSSLSVFGTCVVTALAASDLDRYDFVLLYSYASTVTDLVVCCVAARLMTNMWMPSRFRYRSQSTVSAPSNERSSETPHKSQRKGLANLDDAHKVECGASDSTGRDALSKSSDPVKPDLAVSATSH